MRLRRYHILHQIICSCIYITIDSLFPILPNELQPAIITNYFDIEIVPDLAYGSPFKLASVPLRHAPPFFQHLTALWCEISRLILNFALE